MAAENDHSDTPLSEVAICTLFRIQHNLYSSKESDRDNNKKIRGEMVNVLILRRMLQRSIKPFTTDPWCSYPDHSTVLYIYP
jgi:hypothetical protein